MKNGNGRIKRLIAGGVVALSALAFAPTVAEAAVSTTAFCANVPTGQSGFTDIAQAGVHQRNVECLRGAGIVQGTTATTFSPQATLTRGQMATIIANMIDFADANDAPGGVTVPTLPTAAASQDRFTDDESSVHENNINRLAQANVVRGTTATTFSPELNVTREQMASFIAQAIAFIQGTALPEGADQFTDDEASVHEANINRLGNADIVDGTGARGSKAVYTPGGNCSRAQCASIENQGLAFLFNAGIITAIPGGSGGRDTMGRPEILTASIGTLVPQAQSTAANPAGMRVNTGWDETISTLGGGFGMQAVQADGTTHPCNATDATAGIQSSNRQNIVLNCPSVTSETIKNQITLLEIAEGSVVDFQGQNNPIQDIALGTQSSSQSAAGTTNAPDAVSGAVRGAGSNAFPNTTAVDITFDQVAFAVNAGGIHIILLNGTDQPCTADVGDTTPGSGGTEPGGNGTTTLTVVCNDVTPNTPIPATQVARIVVDAGAVTSATTGGTTNPLQVVELNGGNTDKPDIQNVTFQPDVVLTGGGCPAGGTAVDAVVVDTDNPVAAASAAAASVYSNTGTATPATGGALCNGTANPTLSGNSARFFFPDGTLASAVGFSADDGAFTSNPQGPNEEDEQGVTNQFAIGVTPGQTSRPQITSSAVLRPANPFPGQQSNLVVQITMDERVTLNDPSLVIAYIGSVTAPGTTCSVGGTTETQNIITCTVFNNGGNPASQADFSNIVLVGLRPGAVTGTGGGGDTNVNDASVPTKSA